MEKYKYLIWRNGEKPERSIKNFHNNMSNRFIPDNNINISMVQTNTINYDNNYDNNFNNLVKNESDFVFDNSCDINSLYNINTNTNSSISISQMGEFRKGNNKRETVNNKLNERDIIGNIGQNPFKIDNDYLKDIDNQQKFMIPKSSYDECL